MTASKPTIEAITPWRIESAPSDGPTVSSERYLIEAGRAPEWWNLEHPERIEAVHRGDYVLTTRLDLACDHSDGIASKRRKEQEVAPILVEADRKYPSIGRGAQERSPRRCGIGAHAHFETVIGGTGSRGAHREVIIGHPPFNVPGIFHFERRRAGSQVYPPYVHQLTIADVEHG